MKRKILIAVLIIIVAGAVVAYRMYSKPEPDVTQDRADVAVTAKDLLAAFENDTAAATKLYVDKIVEVTGTVRSTDTSGAVVLGEEGSASEVIIGFDRRHIKEVAQLKAGAVAVLQGKCSGYSKSSSDPDDMLASLGATVHLRSGGIKNKK
jgi:hypothetical protein